MIRRISQTLERKFTFGNIKYLSNEEDIIKYLNYLFEFSNIF